MKAEILQYEEQKTQKSNKRHQSNEERTFLTTNKLKILLAL